MGLSASGSSYRPAQPETLTTCVMSRWVSHGPPHSLSFRPRCRRERPIPLRIERIKRIVLYAVLERASWKSVERTRQERARSWRLGELPSRILGEAED